MNLLHRYMPHKYQMLYNAGIIGSWYLRSSQLKLYNHILNNKKSVIMTMRRFGKTTSAVVYICERAATEKTIIRYGAPTINQAWQILSYIMDEVFKYYPDAKPKRTQNGYRWDATGSELYIFGAKDSTELDKSRGVQADIIYLDEFGFMKYRPEYLVESVLSPQLDKSPNPKLIMTSTPSDDLTHPFINEVALAEGNGSLFRHTIEDAMNEHELTANQYQDIVDRCKGVDTESFQREYMCKLIPSSNRLVIPEMQDADIVKEQPMPQMFHVTIAMDLGLRDHTAVVFCLYDFLNAQMYVFDEYFENYKTTQQHVTDLLVMEQQHNLYMKAKSIRRFADCSDAQQIMDMNSTYQYTISAIQKRSKMNNVGFLESVLNELRVAIGQDQIAIHPRCVKTLAQLKYGIWNDKRTDFERTESMGHLDLLMALAYAWDNIDKSINPYPSQKMPENYLQLDHMQNYRNKEKLSKALLGR